MFRDDLVKFIQEQLLHGRGSPLGAGDSLIDSGVIDSIGLMRIIGFVETSTGVRSPDTMITPDNFQTVTDIERTVEQVRSRK